MFQPISIHREVGCVRGSFIQDKKRSFSSEPDLISHTLDYGVKPNDHHLPLNHYY